jgi:tRNA pseudouridine-54 N-methylase
MTTANRKIRSSLGLSSRPKSREEVLAYKNYMKLSALEMERVRLSIEKEKAEQRITYILQRHRDIETEKSRLLAELSPEEQSLFPGNSAERVVTQTNDTENSGFHFKY